MGYYAHSIDSDFLIKQRNIGPMIQAIKDGYKNYPFITDHDDVGDLFYEFGFDTEFDRQTGDIENVWFCDDKFSSDWVEDFLGVIAPFVEVGSRIEFQGEDDCIWAYYFDGAKWTTYNGHVAFPGMPMGGPSRKRTDERKGSDEKPV